MFFSFKKGVAGAWVLTAGFLAATALLHVLVLDSDLQAWTDALMSINELSSPGDSALGARILMANSFFIIPGIGLYVLTACLLLVPFLFDYTRYPAAERHSASCRKNPHFPADSDSSH